MSSTVPELQSVATSLMKHVYRHFTLIDVGQALAEGGLKAKEFDVHDGEGGVNLSTNILADVLVDCFASDDAALRKAAELAMFDIRDTARTIFGSNEKAAKLPFFSYLTKTFCHRCREVEWFTKSGASLGLEVVATKLELGDAFVTSRQSDLLKALLFIVKDTPHDLPAKTRLTAQHTLEAIVRHSCRSNGEKSAVDSLCNVFITELSHMNKHVRDTAQSIFQIIAEETDTAVYDLIIPIKDRLLQPIFNKPLRALPFLTQIGFIDTITYLLGLGHEIVAFNEQLNRLMMESLALADADAEVLHPKPDDFNNAELIISLRVACLRLLSMAMGLQEFSNPLQNTSRPKIITVFFKSLYSKSSEIIEAANGGLKDVLTQTNKLPKDLLQNGLRPILMNLQDPKRLTVAGLDGLARLLTLLTNYFKVEIGSRLLEHMKALAEDQLMQRISFGLIEQNPQMRIVAAILNIFHLLPPAATTFMSDLVNGVLDLESKLRRTSCSPFRKPLVKYLNRYPSESWTFFSTRLHQDRYGDFFGQILVDPTSDLLRKGVVDHTEELLETCFEVQGDKRIPSLIHGVLIVHAIVSNSTPQEWLQQRPELKTQLLSAAKELESMLRQDELPPSQRLKAEQSGDYAMQIFADHLAHDTGDIDFAMELFTLSAMGEIKTPLILQKFLFDKIINSDDIALRKALIDRSLNVVAQKNASQKVKTFLLHNIVNPVLARDIQKTRVNPKVTALMDKELCDMVHNRLWKPQTGDLNEESLLQGIDHSRMEALQLSALLIKYHKELVSEARKDTIKFAWSYIRLEDVINKYAAYVMISYFIRSYETPPKIAQQIYMALLKAHQNEGRALVTQALEVLAPILPTRLPQTT